MARLHACKYCGRVHATTYDCGRRPKRTYQRDETERGRYTSEWARKAEDIKARSHYLCAACLAQDVLTYEGLEVHHIVKLKERPDLLLEDSNLVCLCTRHHKQADRGEIDAKALYGLVRKRDSIPPGDGG